MRAGLLRAVVLTIGGAVGGSVGGAHERGSSGWWGMKGGATVCARAKRRSAHPSRRGRRHSGRARAVAARGATDPPDGAGRGPARASLERRAIKKAPPSRQRGVEGDEGVRACPGATREASSHSSSLAGCEAGGSTFLSV
jgi:hypothetical protein